MIYLSLLIMTLRRKMSKDASYMVIFGMLVVSIQVKQKSFIIAEVIGTIQNNSDLFINYKNFIMSSMWNINKGKAYAWQYNVMSGTPFLELSNLSKIKE